MFYFALRMHMLELWSEVIYASKQQQGDSNTVLSIDSSGLVKAHCSNIIIQLFLCKISRCSVILVMAFY